MADADIDRFAFGLEPDRAAQASASPDHDVSAARSFLPHPEERRLRLVSKDEGQASWFETAQERLPTMRGQ